MTVGGGEGVFFDSPNGLVIDPTPVGLRFNAVGLDYANGYGYDNRIYNYTNLFPDIYGSYIGWKFEDLSFEAIFVDEYAPSENGSGPVQHITNYNGVVLPPGESIDGYFRVTPFDAFIIQAEDIGGGRFKIKLENNINVWSAGARPCFVIGCLRIRVMVLKSFYDVSAEYVAGIGISISQGQPYDIKPAYTAGWNVI